MIGVLLHGLRMRKGDIKDALMRVPVVGPWAVSAYRSTRTRKPVGRPTAARFEALYQERHAIDDFDTIEDPVQRMYAQHALSSVERGERTRDFVRAYTPLKGKRYLDVGCGYGGHLVAFARARVGRLVGIDNSRHRLDFARALLADYNVQAELEQVDVLDPHSAAGLGRFDIVTCHDVIEHVTDPGAALERLFDLLDEQGLLVMQIPNRYSPSFILSDPHFQVFGLTCLPKRAADRYYDELAGKQQDVTYKSLPFYVNRLAAVGASVRIVNRTPWDVDARLEEIESRFSACERELERPAARASAASRVSVQRHVRRLASTFRRELARYRTLKPTDGGASKVLAQRLWLCFGCDLWNVLAQRDGDAEAARVRWSRGLIAR